MARKVRRYSTPPKYLPSRTIWNFMDALHQTAYASQATRTVTPANLTDILQVSRRNNQANDLTGMLVFRSGHFLQVLEGPQHRVRELLDKVHRDPRHRDLRVLLDGPITARAFGTWSMAFQDISGLDPGALPAYSRFLTDGFSTTECVRYPHKAIRMMLAFRDTDLGRFESLTTEARPFPQERALRPSTSSGRSGKASKGNQGY